MSKVFVNVGLSLDGYMAPEGMTMGKRMFDQGEVAWPEEAPFHTPVYVLTHERRDPWVRPGGTTFYFINDGPERALELARIGRQPRRSYCRRGGGDPAVPEPGCRRRAAMIRCAACR